MTDPRRESITQGGLEGFTSGDGLALVEVWARWSGPSFIVASTVDRFLRQHPGVDIRVARLDADEVPDSLRDLGLASPPALVLFAAGQPVARAQGFVTLETLSTWVHSALKVVGSSSTSEELQQEEDS